MGVTIHYRGKLKSPDLIEELKNELAEIASANEWKYNLLSDNPNNPEFDIQRDFPILNGIMINPKDSDAINMMFDLEGRLVPIFIKMFAPDEREAHLQNIEDLYAFTKTQYAGVEFHIKLCRLLKYISSKYFQEWDCQDDSKYYENEDREALETCMSAIDRALHALEDALEAHGHKLDESSPEDIKIFFQEVLANEDVQIETIRLSDEEE